MSSEIELLRAEVKQLRVARNKARRETYKIDRRRKKLLAEALGLNDNDSDYYHIWNFLFNEVKSFKSKNVRLSKRVSELNKMVREMRFPTYVFDPSK